MGLAQYADLFHTLGITGDKTEIANLDEAGVADMVNTCVSEGGASSETNLEYLTKHLRILIFNSMIKLRRRNTGRSL